MPSVVESIKVNTSKQIYYGVYINDAKQSDIVTISYTGATSDCYSVVNITDGIEIKCLKITPTLLNVTFTNETLTKTLQIKLSGLL